MLAVTLHGPNYFAPNHDDNSIELFDNLQDAIEAMLHRYAANGASTCYVEYISGKHEDVFFPAFEHGHYFQCYELTCSETRPLTEESIEEALTAVHNGVCEWYLSLADIDGNTVVVVSNTGIQ